MQITTKCFYYRTITVVIFGVLIFILIHGTLIKINLKIIEGNICPIKFLSFISSVIIVHPAVFHTEREMFFILISSIIIRTSLAGGVVG